VIDILLLGTFFGIEELQQRLEQASVEDVRFSVVFLSLGLVQMAPWLGHGPGTFYAVFPQVRNYEIFEFFDHTHSDLVEFPLEVGVVGALPLVALFCLAFYMALRVQITRHNRFYRAMGFSVTMAMISIGLHSSTDFNLQIFANAATFVCIMAMPWLAMYLPSRRKSRQT